MNKKNSKKSVVQVIAVNISVKDPAKIKDSLPESMALNIDVPPSIVEDDQKLFDYLEDNVYSLLSSILKNQVMYCQIYIQNINGVSIIPEVK